MTQVNVSRCTQADARDENLDLILLNWGHVSILAHLGGLYMANMIHVLSEYVNDII